MPRHVQTFLMIFGLWLDYINKNCPLNLNLKQIIISGEGSRLAFELHKKTLMHWSMDRTTKILQHIFMKENALIWIPINQIFTEGPIDSKSVLIWVKARQWTSNYLTQ